MRPRDDFARAVTVTGVDSYPAASMDFDVAGTWGGKRAIVAHFCAGRNNEVLLMYMLVGSYWRVGQRQSESAPSPWEVAKVLTWALQIGIDPASLYDAITDVIAEEG